MRIAIDIDSTLHHYWDQFARGRQRRFGVELPYERQTTWGDHAAEPEQVHACVRETHSQQFIAAAVPYPGAVETVNAGTPPATSSTSPAIARRTRTTRPSRWLEAIGLRHDELYCSYDKITPLPGDRDRSAGRRQPREPRAGARGGHRRRDDRASVEPRRLVASRRIAAPTTGRARRGAGAAARPRRADAAGARCRSRDTGWSYVLDTEAPAQSARVAASHRHRCHRRPRAGLAGAAWGYDRSARDDRARA